MDYAYTAIVDGTGYSIGRADRGTKGYTPCPQYGMFPGYGEAMSKAKELNEAVGLAQVEAFGIVAGTMF